MPMPDELQQCRDACAKVADTLRTVTNTLQSQRAKEALTGGAFHLEQCVHDCDQAIIMVRK